MRKFDIDLLPNPVLVYDSAWRIDKVNKAALTVLGFEKKEEILGQPMSALFLHDDFSEIIVLQNFAENIPSEIEKRNGYLRNKKNQRIRLFSRISKTYQRIDHTFFIQSLMEVPGIPDVNEGKTDSSALNYYALLAENIPGLEVFLVNKDLEILSKLGNETFYRGWNKIPAGKEFMNYFPEPIVNQLKPLLKIAFESTPVSQEVYENDNYYSIRIIPIVDRKKVYQCVIVLQNISEAKIIQNQLKLSKEESEEANRAKDDFVAKMSHEIRTPLNAISGFTEQLRKTPLTKIQQDYVNIVINSSRHLLTLIDDILVLSKIELGQMELEEVAFKISEITQAVHEMLEIKLQKKNISFESSVSPELDDYIVGDPAKLRQVLLNLADNAVKFTNRGRINISCKLINEIPGIKQVKFEVIDSGIGISKENIEKIFNPFHQVNSSYDRSFIGCGLGLTISRDIIQTMGGTLDVESTPGKGSVFSFVLNFRVASEPEMAGEELARTVDLENLHVLFVDDDKINRMLGEIILKKYNIRTDFAKSGLEALKFFVPGKYDIIFLDINMPDINGMDVTRYMRQIEKAKNTSKKTVIIAMTANAVSKHVKQYLECGMDSVMLKPYDEDTLYRKIISIAKKITEPLDVLQQPVKSLVETSYDLDNLLMITRGDKEFTLLMLDTFIENSEKLLGKIKKSYIARNYVQIAEAAHRLSPSMEQLGISRASNLLKEIEEKYLDGKNGVPDTDPLIDEAIVEINSGIGAIRKATVNIKQQQE
jgi:signal transduction histidine kinase/CheY-like chemotaxis protein/HPt (histidine-containing phosphotransfer) domain-containing protein